MANDIFERDVLPLFEQTRAEWLAEAREAARILGERFPEVTVNDVRDVCPPPEGWDGRVMAGIFLSKDWELLRHQRTSRRVSHNRPIGVFRLRARV